MNLRDLKVGTRAAVIFLLLGVLVLGMGLIALYEAKRMDSATDAVRDVWLPGVITLGDIGTNLGRLRALGLRAVLLEDQGERDKTLATIRTLSQSFPKALSDYQATIQDAEDRALFNDFKSRTEHYHELQARIIQAVEAGRRDEAMHMINGPLADSADSMMGSLYKLSHYNSDNAIESAQVSSDVFDEAFVVIVSALVATMAAMALIAVILTRSIVKPLGEAVVVADRVAGGDLTRSIAVSGQDEPAQLLKALNLMQNNLRDTISQIAASSDQLTSASEELSSVTEDASRGLHKQNAEIEQAATAVNEMTAAVEEVASNAVITAEASRDADKSTHEGRDKVNQALESIQLLVQDVTTTSQDIEALAGQVQDISQVLDVIRSVAEQTNLLALNAAIEAARAGEAGRGFAVVADEVRGLAHRTQESTREIESMIAGIQAGSGKAVEAMHTSRQRATSTLDVASEADAALEVIAQSINAINQRNLVIASASEQQAQVAREVDRNLVNIRDLSLQTSAGANQTSAASQELSGLAVGLNGMISRFKV
ncbi:methyl-accepting chemotaxis protein [Pseudomonas sp. DTU_2021_1001937_2_SI_NGA_ILE_001]|uniref:methyl-accepting chemotaxis protein n=1 Tax=Pseudomonas sp. DTU_2021_1001937_2_SI_NGA_ILE_001 TaxID=3077589 RepID=UPI0028FC2BEC|nr:methyl-accepting chemotaxis protein [Pseudomonas sp. DTU_2021_1001937_2_SI_NGA_ILE_001]WNW12184.1 methyl-accepting chemotaxis protein [Pseudomonas sp. DTU_2021_1001937_2_SI_NGA_ILE_001]